MFALRRSGLYFASRSHALNKLFTPKFASTARPATRGALENGMVSETIAKMLDGIHHSESAGLDRATENLEQSVARAEKKLFQARECVNDCFALESNSEEDLKCAEIALDGASGALLELIEDIQEYGGSNGQQYDDVRQMMAEGIKELRNELKELGQQ